MRLCVLLLLLLFPAHADAQDIAAEWSLWRLGASAASSDASSRPGATIRLGLPVISANSVIQLGATYAFQEDVAPGLLHLDAEVATRLLGAPGSDANLFVTGGIGALRFAADRQQSIISACERVPTCIYEGSVYRSGWRVVVSGGLGADLPVSDALLLQPTVRVLRLVGNGDAGPLNAGFLVRFGIGLSLRL